MTDKPDLHLIRGEGTGPPPPPEAKPPPEPLGGCTTGGWYWYCDLHDTHGQADFEDEAEAVAAAHQEWWAVHAVDPDDAECDYVILKVGESVEY